MLIGEPDRTQADLNFKAFGIPIRVHPFFWVAGLMLGMQIKDPVLILVWIVALFVSILVHELGHAFAARYFGYEPWITLYAFGGLASYQPYQQTPRSRILILLAGPGAGFALAGLISLGILASGHRMSFEFARVPFDFERYESPVLNFLLFQLLYINIFWGLINLFPVYPLDGGQIAREIMVESNPQEGIRQSLILSIATAIALAIAGMVWTGDIFMGVLFGYLAYMSYATLQAYYGRGGSGRW